MNEAKLNLNCAQIIANDQWKQNEIITNDITWQNMLLSNSDIWVSSERDSQLLENESDCISPVNTVIKGRPENQECYFSDSNEFTSSASLNTPNHTLKASKIHKLESSKVWKYKSIMRGIRRYLINLLSTFDPKSLTQKIDKPSSVHNNISLKDSDWVSNYWSDKMNKISSWTNESVHNEWSKECQIKNDVASRKTAMNKRKRLSSVSVGDFYALCIKPWSTFSQTLSIEKEQDVMYVLSIFLKKKLNMEASKKGHLTLCFTIEKLMKNFCIKNYISFFKHTSVQNLFRILNEAQIFTEMINSEATFVKERDTYLSLISKLINFNNTI